MSRQQSIQDSEWSRLNASDGASNVSKFDVDIERSVSEYKHPLGDLSLQNVHKPETAVHKHDKEELIGQLENSISNDLQKVKENDFEVVEHSTEAGKTTPSVMLSSCKDIDLQVHAKSALTDLTPVHNASEAGTKINDASGKTSKHIQDSNETNKETPVAISGSVKSSPKPPTEHVQGIVGNWLDAMPGSSPTMLSDEVTAATKSILRSTASHGKVLSAVDFITRACMYARY